MQLTTQHTEKVDPQELLNEIRKGTNIIQIQMFGPPERGNDQVYRQIHAFDQIIQMNNSTILELMKQIDRTSGQLVDINSHMITFQENYSKTTDKEEESKKVECRDLFLHDESTTPNANILRNVFGEQKYKYQIVLSKPFDKLLYKQRTFELAVKIVDSNGNMVMNSNRIPISLSAYFNEDNPTQVQETRLKDSIFKGNNESEIFQGEGRMKKLQFKEVSSFYTSHNLFFIIYAKSQSMKYSEESNVYQERLVNCGLVRPLVITNITVKAKKK